MSIDLPGSDDIRQKIIAALNAGDHLELISIDQYGDVFDASYGEYGSVILSARQLDNLVELVTTTHLGWLT